MFSLFDVLFFFAQDFSFHSFLVAATVHIEIFISLLPEFDLGTEAEKRGHFATGSSVLHSVHVHPAHGLHQRRRQTQKPPQRHRQRHQTRCQGKSIHYRHQMGLHSIFK